MAKDSKPGRMVLDIMDSMFKVKSTEKVNSLGLMEAHTMENLSRITSKAKESIIGPTAVSMMDSGKIIRWKAMVFSRGLMAEGMKVLMSTIRRKDKETSTGQMDVNTKVAGRTENNMALELTHPQVGKPSRVSGLMVRGFTGFPIPKD